MMPPSACRSGSEVHHFGATQADVQHFGAGVADARCDRVRELAAGQADVTAQDHVLRAEKFDGSVADAVGDIDVQFVRDLATDVVGLEAVDGDAHRSILIPHGGV